MGIKHTNVHLILQSSATCHQDLSSNNRNIRTIRIIRFYRRPNNSTRNCCACMFWGWFGVTGIHKEPTLATPKTTHGFHFEETKSFIKLLYISHTDAFLKRKMKFAQQHSICQVGYTGRGHMGVTGDTPPRSGEGGRRNAKASVGFKHATSHTRGLS